MEEGRKVRPAPRGVQLKWDSTKMGIVWFIWWIVRGFGYSWEVHGEGTYGVKGCVYHAVDEEAPG